MLKSLVIRMQVSVGKQACIPRHQIIAADVDHVGQVLSQTGNALVKELKVAEAGIFVGVGIQSVDGRQGEYFGIGIGLAEGFVKISEEQEFYINDAGNIVICFNEYVVAAGAEGCPEFEIPTYVIEKIRK